MKILITGGHITPAIAVIDYLQEKKKQYEVVFVGRLYTQDELKQEAIEKDLIEARKIKFIPFNGVKFTGGPIIKIFRLFKFIGSLIKAFDILTTEKPDIYLSFGGYLAVPIAIAARFLKIPIVTHEQTITLGKANKIVSRFADKIAVSFWDSKKHFKQDKVVFTGNPIRKAIFKRTKKPSFIKSTKKPVLLVMGGNQGSKTINQVIEDSFLDLLPNYQIVHQCGRPNKNENYKASLLAAAQKLPEKLNKYYYVKEWISQDELAWLYKNVDCVISRSGANTVLELAATHNPAIFIPLPFAFNNEQYLNAHWLFKQRASLILEQNKLNKHHLLKKINQFQKSKKVLKKNIAEIKVCMRAEKELVKLLEEVVNE